ncbi:hypothetical protein L1987_39999 [Smallanthus sonchifolius]|uniref:Uncharacterized protein n=1 Tax=Smallanthus sonchifolius TaxID=185202 RepID=A0ACB9GUJ7_9ASTR|nr:hypothetical protein L1987_39999 [Smallanthus sonchifolius]
MRKLYNHNKGKIHPSPPPSTTDHLSFLPLAIAALAASLEPEDKEVLAYLLSCSQTTTTTTTDNINKNFSNTTKATDKTGGGHHPPKFNCYCFSCYTSYWVRWDVSPNRQVIHEIIDAYEDGLVKNKKSGKNKKERKKYKVSPSLDSPHAPEEVSHAPPLVEEDRVDGGGDDDGGQEELVIEASQEKGPVRKFVNFLGERIWGVWGGLSF